MSFGFAPLELWRASTISQETKAAISAYEECLNAGDLAGLAALRAAIESRIDDLESFYIANLNDERSILFEKQRLKLRKLLHEFDTAQQAALAQEAEAGAGGADASSFAQFNGVVTKTIHEDSRLTLEELTAWFEQAGIEEMPEVTTAAIAAVFSSVTRTNRDGLLSIRDLRQWYITFGRHALAAGLDVSAPGAAIVAPALMKTRSFSTGSTLAGGAAHGGAAAAQGGGSFGPRRAGPSAAAGTMHAAAAAALLGEEAGAASGGAGAATASHPMYSWEKGPAVHSAGEFSASGASPRKEGGGSSPVRGAPPQQQQQPFTSIPNGLLEFQVRLTAEEHASLCLRRRMAEAETRYKARVEEGHARLAAKRGEDGGAGAAGAGGSGASALLRAAPYVDPADRNAYFLRT